MDPAVIVRQRSNWDCGVACIASVVTAARGDPVSLSDVCAALPTVRQWQLPLSTLSQMLSMLGSCQRSIGLVD